MWSTEHTAETAAGPEQVWAALRDVHSGLVDGGGDTFVLHGPFAVGTRLSVTPHGQDTFSSTIVELLDTAVYADRTDLGDVSLVFRHTLTALDSGGTRVAHALTIDGVGADEVGPVLGPQISEDFPATLQNLFAIAARSGAAGLPAVGTGHAAGAGGS